MNDELGSSKVGAITDQLEIQDLPSIDEPSLQIIETELREVVLLYNFDSFSFLFELLDLADKNKINVGEAFKIFEINSLRLAEKYGGSNCAGLSLTLQRSLATHNISTEVAPSYGQYLALIEADEYAQVRTVDLIGVLRKGSDNIWVFLAPGLTIDKPILVVEGFAVQSFDRRYEVKDITNRGFTFVTVKPNGERLERFFGFDRFLNPDQSSQKNLLRCRVKYQITRQYEDHREQITFNFATKRFKVKIREIDSVFTPEEFAEYLMQHAEKLNQGFNNPHLVGGFQLLLKYLDEIKDTLLIPQLQNYIREP